MDTKTAVDTLHGMFSEIDRETILMILQYNGFRVEASIEQLLAMGGGEVSTSSAASQQQPAVQSPTPAAQSLSSSSSSSSSSAVSQAATPQAAVLNVTYQLASLATFLERPLPHDFLRPPSFFSAGTTAPSSSDAAAFQSQQDAILARILQAEFFNESAVDEGRQRAQPQARSVEQVVADAGFTTGEQALQDSQSSGTSRQSSGSLSQKWSTRLSSLRERMKSSKKPQPKKEKKSRLRIGKSSDDDFGYAMMAEDAEGGTEMTEMIPFGQQGQDQDSGEQQKKTKKGEWYLVDGEDEDNEPVLYDHDFNTDAPITVKPKTKKLGSSTNSKYTAL